MGTPAEFKQFVDTAHSQGIRVVMDVVMNHAGYNTLKDMHEFNYGSTTAGAYWTPGSEKTGLAITALLTMMVMNINGLIGGAKIGYAWDYRGMITVAVMICLNV